MATLDVYARISADREGAGLGVARQEKDCRAHLHTLGHQVGEVLIDNDISGYKRKTRPGYQRMLQRLSDGTSDGFVVWHLDRLTRHPAELEEVIEVVERQGALVLTVTGGAYDLATTDGRAMARVVGAFARKESEDKARRTKRKHLELAQSGRPVGGTRHFGFDPLYVDGVPVLVDHEGYPTLQVRPGEAAVIRDAARSVLAGESVRSIVKRWNAAGVVAARGGRMTAGSVQRILRSPTIAGWRGLDGTPIAEGRWEPIVDVDTWRQVVATLDTRAASITGGFRGGKPRTYLLTGLLHCGRCDTLMVAQARPDRKRSYTCPSDPSKAGCGGVRIVAPDLEDEIRDRLVERVDMIDLAAATPAPDDPTGRLLDNLARIEADSRMLAADYYDAHLIDRAQFFAAKAALDTRMAATKAQVAHAAQRTALAPMMDPEWIEARWEAWSLGERRAALDMWVERIIINPATGPRGRFDPTRLEVIWLI